MALLAVVALLGLAAYADATCCSDGSSAFKGVLQGLAGPVVGGITFNAQSLTAPATCPQTAGMNYGAGGSGNGRTWARNAYSFLAFGDNSYSGAVISGSGASAVYKNGPLPSTVVEFPVAIGAIALHRQPIAGIPVTACLSTSMLCRIFTKAGDFTPPGLTYKALNGAWPAVTVTPCIRLDSSGSTDALTAFLNTICPKPWAFPITTTPGVKSADGTGNLMNLIAATAGSTGYASCGSVAVVNGVKSPGATVEWAVQNRRGVCVKCHQCATATPTPGSQCGVYSQFKIQPRLCAWTGVKPNGDKDGDNDDTIDLDQDGDGTGPNDYPTVFLEYAMMPSRAPATATERTCCQLFQRLLVFLININTQNKLATYGFFPLPTDILKSSCACLSARPCGLAYRGVYEFGSCK